MSIRGNWEKRRVGSMESLREIDRRTFVKLTGLSAAALVLGVGPSAQNAPFQPRFSDYPFSLGVASGDPLPDGMVLWTRLAPDPLNSGGIPDREVPVRWQVASDENFRRVVREGTEFARAELAHSVHAEVEGLEPGREHFYRFKIGPEVSPVGRTKTAPEVGASVSEVNFAFASCQQHEHGYYTAYRGMSEEDLDLVVYLGDYIYEYGTYEDLAPGRQRPSPQRSAHLHAFGIPRPPRPVPLRRRPAGSACGFPLDRHLGRPRGSGQLRRYVPRAGTAIRGLRSAAGGRLSGVLRTHAPEAFLGTPGAGCAPVQAPLLMRPGRVQRPGHPPVPRRPGKRRRHQAAEYGVGRSGAHAHGRRAGALAAGRARRVGGALERPRPVSVLRPDRLPGRGRAPAPDGRLGRVAWLPRPDPGFRRAEERREPRRPHGQRPPQLGQRALERLRRSRLPAGRRRVRRNLDHLRRGRLRRLG